MSNRFAESVSTIAAVVVVVVLLVVTLGMTGVFLGVQYGWF